MKRTISLILIISLLVCLLSGCRINGKDPSISTEINADEPASSSAETEEHQENADELLLSVLSGDAPVVMPGGAAEYLSEYLRAQNNAKLISYAFIDFDHDECNELVLQTSSDLYTYIILHRSGSDVFAFLFGARQLGELKADGSFLSSNGAASTAYFTLRFNGGGYISTCEASGDYAASIFETNGKPCSEQEFNDFADNWDRREDANWISLKASSEETHTPQGSDEVIYTYGEFCPTLQDYADFVVALTPVIDQWVLVSDDESGIVYAPKGYQDGNKGMFHVAENAVFLSKHASYHSPRTFQVYYSPTSSMDLPDLTLSTDLFSSFDALLSYAAPFLNALPGALSRDELLQLFEHETTTAYGVKSLITTVNAVTYTIHQDITAGTTMLTLIIDEAALVPGNLLWEGTSTPTQPLPFETVPSETSPAQSNPTQTTSPETVPTTQSPEAIIPYLQKIFQPDQSIFDGPSYDYSFVGTVEVAGTYTIVEEAWDEEGNLWGKLKSGAGWVDLTDIRSSDAASTPVSANYADDRLLDSGNYHHCIADTSEYMVQIAFRTNEILTDFTLHSIQFNGDGFAAEEVLFSLEELNPNKPLVADVAFPGDMSMYGIRFVDSDGTIYNYAVSISGRNGSVVLSEYTP